MRQACILIVVLPFVLALPLIRRSARFYFIVSGAGALALLSLFFLLLVLAKDM